MATNEELAATRRRRGYWIKVARDRKAMTLDAVAELLGYAPKSGSTISLWEDGKRPVPSDKMGVLAELLDIPHAWLVKPPLTDEERLEAAIQSASDAERADWDEEQGEGPKAEGAPVVELRRRSA